MATRKSSKSTKSNGKTTSRSSGDALKNQFEKRIEDVRSRFKTFEKEWGTTVDKLVTRGRSAEKDLRKRIDRVTKDLGKNDLLSRVRKSSVVKRVSKGDLLGGLNYERALNDLRKDVRGFQDDVVDFFEASKSRIKQVIDLPTRGDFERLNRKIEQLSTQVRSLEKRKRA